MHSNKETLAIAWCDNGLTDGKFTDGIVGSIIGSKLPIVSSMRVNGNQIARQRQVVFDTWADSIKTDWLLWIDSDIVVDKNVLELLWNSADKVNVPVVSGTYFISHSGERSPMVPLPALFFEGRDDKEMQYVHPLPENQLIKVDYAGFGILLMHKSIIEPMRNIDKDISVFAEHRGSDSNDYVGEDVSFFRKLKSIGIPLHAHTGALVEHIKRFPLDITYYGMYWNSALANE